MDEKELLQIIRQAAKDRTTSLSLSQKGLTVLPLEIGELTYLTYLDLSQNQLTSLPPEISNLVNLTILTINRNQLTSLPPEIGNLVNLTHLIIWNNQLTRLPPEIGNLVNLTTLNLDGNQLTSLPPEIGNLVNLVSLTFPNNQLTSLPPEIGNLVNLTNLEPHGNPLPIPPEIRELKDKPAEIINYYLQHLAATEKKSLNEAKVLIVGQGGVGKTSLVKRLVDGKYNPQESKTEGIDIRRWHININDNHIRLNIWDFGGQEIMHATHQFFLTKRSLYVLVLDGRQGEQESRIEYWLKLIQSFGGDSPIIVVINKIDQQRLDIDRRGLQSKYETIKAFIETSCEKNVGFAELKGIVTSEVGKLEHTHDQLLNSWFAIKTKLEEMKQNYISLEEYQSMCKAENIDDELSQKTLIRFLHDLGTILSFQDDLRLSETNVLNPEWVTNGVYRILNSNELFHSKGILAIEKLGGILDSREYPKNKHGFIIDMMVKFELCFGFEGNKEFLIPDLLSKEEPDLNWPYDNSLAFQYHYNFLPGSVISRFIVRMHQFISRNTYWRTGVVLNHKDNKALVKADLEDRKIFIYVTGKQQTRRSFLEIIRADFDRIHSTIPKIEAKEKVPLPGREDIVADYNHLLDLEGLGEETFVPEGLKERVSVKKLLDGIETEESRKEKRGERERGDRLQQMSPPPSPPNPTSRNNPWLSGSFYLFAFVVVVAASALVGIYVSWKALPVVLIAGLLAITVVGALQLRNDDRFSDEGFLTLMIEFLRSLNLLRSGESPDQLEERKGRKTLPPKKPASAAKQ
jgi:internalin A